MRILSTLAALAALLLGSSAQAQTTGVPFLNDLTVNGFGSGGVSCASFTLSSTAATFTVTGDPGALAVVAYSPNGCAPAVACLPPVPCPIPFSACGGGTNRSIDLLPPLFVGCSFVLNAAGTGSCTVAIPPGTFVGVQAVVLPSASCGGVFVTTQAYNVVF